MQGPELFVVIRTRHVVLVMLSLLRCLKQNEFVLLTVLVVSTASKPGGSKMAAASCVAHIAKAVYTRMQLALTTHVTWQRR